MKRSILYIIIVILLCVISCGVTYLLLDNKDKEVVEYYDKNNESEEDYDNIVISDDVLKEYLNYVPVFMGSELEKQGYKSAYELKKLSIDTINNDYLLYNALRLTLYDRYNYYDDATVNDDSYPPHDGFMKKEVLNALLFKVYNLELDNFTLKESYDTYVFDFAICGECFYFYENGFAYFTCSSGDDDGGIDYIINYEVKYDKLLIYSYHLKYSYLMDSDEENNYYKDIKLYDEYLNKYFFVANSLKENYDDIDRKCNDYIEKNKDKFTKYKHTFKKNNNGYYWYSTEVVES